jgi:hypothetical protein
MEDPRRWLPPVEEDGCSRTEVVTSTIEAKIVQAADAAHEACDLRVRNSNPAKEPRDRGPRGELCHTQLELSRLRRVGVFQRWSAGPTSAGRSAIMTKLR